MNTIRTLWDRHGWLAIIAALLIVSLSGVELVPDALTSWLAVPVLGISAGVALMSVVPVALVLTFLLWLAR